MGIKFYTKEIDNGNINCREHCEYFSEDETGAGCINPMLYEEEDSYIPDEELVKLIVPCLEEPRYCVLFKKVNGGRT